MAQRQPTADERNAVIDSYLETIVVKFMADNDGFTRMRGESDGPSAESSTRQEPAGLRLGCRGERPGGLRLTPSSWK